MKNRERILLVDDSKENIEIIKNSLSNYSIIFALNGEKAMDKILSDNPPDLILLDVMMPDIDGYEICKRVKSNEKVKNIPVIFITGKTGVDDETYGLSLGAVDYITKPIISKLLKVRVETQLKLKRTQKALEEEKEYLEDRVKERTEEYLREKEIAERASQAKSDFLANISHELRTPLNGIISFVEFLKEAELGNPYEEYIEIINESSEKLLDMIVSLLKYSAIESGKIKKEMKEFNIDNLVEFVNKVFSGNAEKRGNNFIVNYQSTCHKVLIGDKDKIKEIIAKLVSNALKFTEDGEVELKLRCIDVSGEAELLEISIKDTGIGISEEKKEKIFEEFIQGEYYLNKKYQGLGIGLTMVKNLVDYLEGDIEFDSREGEGTNITVRLPLEVKK